MIDTITRLTGCALAPPAPSQMPALRCWARSGLMALTGSRDAAPLFAPRDYCARIAALRHGTEAFAAAAGMPITVRETVLTERAALLGLTRNGTLSANGACRMIRAKDGWLAVNLPRDSDMELLPAWLGREIDGVPWPQIEQAARDEPCNALVERAQLLGLAVSRIAEDFTPPPPVVRMAHPAAPRGRRPRVLDLSSLWAGPLCGALLAEAGADVIKLESVSRPDGARLGDPAFFARLNGAKRSLVLDLPRERETLGRLFAAADIVIESARPRVLAQWDFSLAEIFATNPHLVWISITGYGRESARANWVGFGDDVAAAAGLVIEKDGAPNFVGDAIADPLAGLAAAASTFACLAAGGGFLVDASLFAAAGFVATAPPVEEAASLARRDQGWIVHGDDWSEAVYLPVADFGSAGVRPLGADSDAVLREMLS